MPRIVAHLLLLSLAACVDKEASDGEARDSGDAGDTGPSDTGPAYETGCIVVDGEGGYANIQDAVTVAVDGSTITLCSGTWEEAVTVDKAVTIEGAGVDSTTIVAPTNMAPFTITASDVTIRWLALESTRSGVVVEESSGVTLSELAFLAVDNYGVSASDATDLTIENCTFSGTGYGGVQVAGGGATIRDSTFDDNTSFGIHGTDGAELTIEDNVITDTAPLNIEDVTDGHGIWLEEADGTLSGNKLSGNFFIGVFADGGDLSLDGDSVSDSLYGVALLEGDLDASGLTLTDNYYHGLLGVSTATLRVSGSAVSGDPDVVASYSSSRWGSESVGYAGSGIYLVGPEIAVSETTVTGYNNAGIVVTPYDFDVGATVTLQDVTLEANGRIGLWANTVDLVATNVTIRDLIEVEDAGEEQCFSVGVNAAATLYESTITWEGGSVEDNDGYGLAPLYSVIEVSGATFAGNACGGIMNFGGALVATGNTFTRSNAGSFEGGLVSYEGSSATVVGNTFVDNQTWGLSSTSEYEDSSGNTRRYEYYQYLGSDIQIWRGGTNEVQDNVFERGTESIVAYQANVNVEGNTWTDYRGVVFYSASEDGSTTLSVEEAVVDTFYSYGVLCSQGAIDLSDVTFTTGGSYSYHYDAYLNDALDYSYDISYANPVLYGYDCAMVADDVAITDTSGHVLRGYGGAYELTGLTAETVGSEDYSFYDTMYFYGYLDTEVLLSDVEISDVVVGGGIGLYVYDDVTTTLSADGLTLSGVSGTALTLQRYSDTYPGTEVDLTGVRFAGASAGINAVGSTLVASEVTISEVSGVGVALDEVTWTGNGVVIVDAGSDGMQVSGGSVTLSDSEIVGSAESGLVLSSTTGDVTGNAFTGNGGYGMECSSVTFTSCGNDLSDNNSGTQSGCDESCDSSAATEE